MPEPRRALVLVDVQQDYFDGPLAIEYPPREDSLARILDAVDVAERVGIPVVVVQHESPSGAPVFAAGSAGQQLPPQLEQRLHPEWKRITKRFASVFDGTDLADWCREHDIRTLTLAGYMTNNCILATAAAAAPHGLSAEVLSDATGAIPLSNEAGTASARHVHETLMTLLHSNFAAVTTTEAWAARVQDGAASPRSNLLTSATEGRAAQPAS